MTRLRVLLSRLLDLVRGRARDARLEDELQAHLDLLADEYMARGMDPEHARRAARRTFGNVDRVRAAYREQRGLPALDSFAQDVRFAVRQVWRHPGFTVTAVLILGLGIGVNNLFFTILHAHTMRGLPVHRADRVLSIAVTDDRTPSRDASSPVSAGSASRDRADAGSASRNPAYVDEADAGSASRNPAYVDELRRLARSFAGLAAFTTQPMIVADNDRAPERLEGAFVSAETFDVLGVRPVLGRTFNAGDDRRGAPAVTVLGSGVWRSRYGGGADVLGSTITVNGAQATVVGIMPDRSGFPSSAEVWLPLGQHPGMAAGSGPGGDLLMLGRLHDQATPAGAREELSAILDTLSREHAGTEGHLRANVIPINERYLGSLTHPAWLAFMAAGCLIVLIACANVANLLLARSAARTREIAIRTSLGASRRRVVRQMLVEGAVLAALGGSLGLAVAAASVAVFSSAIPEHVLPYWFDYSFDGRVLAALMLVSVATVFVFALLPAIHASRTDVSHVLKDGAGAGHVSRGRTWSTLVLAAELALAVVLLAHLAVSIRSAAPDLPAERALDATRIVTATLTLPTTTYRTPDERQAFHDRLRERLRGIPGVSSSVTSALPLMGAQPRELAVAGQQAVGGAAPPQVSTVAIGPGYFATLGVALMSGREFAAEDGTPGHDHVIVNEHFVREFLDDAPAVGERIALSEEGDPEPVWLTIVGVAPTIRQRPGSPRAAVAYVPHRTDSAPDVSLVVSSGFEAETIVPLLRGEVQALDAHLPLYQVRTMAQVLRDANWNGRLSSRLFLYLTLVAVALSTAGLFTVTACHVSGRTREIALRMALGAQRRHVVRLILRHAALQVALGLAAGLLFTRAWESIFPTGIAGVRTTDPQSLGIVAAILTAMALVACIAPARRAIRLDPMATLRGE